MKIAINKCFGGFGLSPDGIALYAKLKMSLKERQKENLRLYHGDIDRTDPALIQTIKELGERANGEYADLKIVEIPDGVEWELDEYDGVESVHEKHRSWG